MKLSTFSGPACRVPQTLSVLALAVALAVAAGAAEANPQFTAYVQEIPGSTVTFEMVPIPGGTLTIGSPATEPGRDSNDVAQAQVTVKPFWMGKYEVTWQEFVPWVFGEREDLEKEKAAGITRPTKPYGSVYRERGEKGFPALGMSQLAATEFCRWLSWKTGKPYRLPTDAEWEYACRAGATTTYFWGDDPALAKEYACFADNSQQTTKPVGQLKPNKFGLYDILGNVSEWTARATPDAPAFTRGGAFTEKIDKLRCAARLRDCLAWNELDPQSPQSIWWLSAADFAGLRVVRSCEEETPAATHAATTAAPAATVPVSTPAGSAAVGAAKYQQFCAGCHGPTGKGDGRVKLPDVKARDYTDPKVKATLTDAAAFKAIKEGFAVNGKMVMHPSKLTNEEINAVVAFMKGL